MPSPNSVNVGNDPVLPSPPCSQHGGGQAHRPLLAPGRGGAAVVLRDRKRPGRMGKGGSV